MYQPRKRLNVRQKGSLAGNLDQFRIFNLIAFQRVQQSMIKMRQACVKRKKAAKNLLAMQAKAETTQRLVQERGRWLFSNECQNLSELSEPERQAQIFAVQSHKALMVTHPGEHLYLCLMRLPRNPRDNLRSHVRKSSRKRCDYQSRQFFAESVPVLLRSRNIIINGSGIGVIASLMDRVQSGDADRAVSSLTLLHHIRWHLRSGYADSKFSFNSFRETDKKDSKSHHRIWAGEDIAARCTALRHLTLFVQNFNFIISCPHKDENPSAKLLSLISTDHVQRCYPLDALMHCPALRSFKLVAVGDHLIPDLECRECRGGSDPEAFFKPLVDWLKSELASKAPGVAFEVDYVRRVDTELFVGFKESV
ncbi:hypothetical protein Ptr902_00399 [Pyrenophora tritici-repentis]|nr:hypothetical protein Ptr902_00399 [Pyrenophora tritici-repentis]